MNCICDPLVTGFNLYAIGVIVCVVCLFYTILVSGIYV